MNPVEDKDFRVAQSCGSCKYFFSMTGYGGGKKRNGYCLQAATAESIPAHFGSWEDFVALWNGTLDRDEYIKQHGTAPEWVREWEGNAWRERAKRRYDDLEKVVNFWKRNRDRIHTANKDNVCDLYLKKSRGGHASRHVRDWTIDWLERLSS